MIKKMILTAFVAVAGLVSAQAQIGTPRLEVGATFSNQTSTIGSLSASTNAKLGFRAAGAYELNIAPSFYLAPGVAYQYNRNGLDGSTYNHHALQVPVYLGYKVGFTPLLTISLEAGPYAEFGLSKTEKSGNLSVDLYKDSVERFDAGIGGSVALHCNQYYVRLGAQYGLLDISKQSVLGTHVKLKQANFSVSVGMNL